MFSLFFVGIFEFCAFHSYLLTTGVSPCFLSFVLFFLIFLNRQITSLLFNSLASSKFRSDIKRWRLFADIIVDIGITLEVAATLVPPAFFLPMICKFLRFSFGLFFFFLFFNFFFFFFLFLNILFLFSWLDGLE